MEQYFAMTFDDVRHELSLILPLSLTDPDLLREIKFTVYENDNIKNLALEKLHWQRVLKEYIAMSLLESQ